MIGKTLMKKRAPTVTAMDRLGEMGLHVRTARVTESSHAKSSSDTVEITSTRWTVLTVVEEEKPALLDIFVFIARGTGSSRGNEWNNIVPRTLMRRIVLIVEGKDRRD